jgi:hypothetical protein
MLSDHYLELVLLYDIFMLNVYVSAKRVFLPLQVTLAHTNSEVADAKQMARILK